jgi:hypothetical protein
MCRERENRAKHVCLKKNNKELSENERHVQEKTKEHITLMTVSLSPSVTDVSYFHFFSSFSHSMFLDTYLMKNYDILTISLS